MKKLVLLILICSTIGCKTYEKIYCIKGDPKSIVIIDKKNPFLVYDKNKEFSLKAIAENSTKFKLSLEESQKKTLTALLTKIESKDFLKYTGNWTVFKSQPCQDGASQKFREDVNRLEEFSKRLTSAVELSKNLTNSNGLGGGNVQELFKILAILADENL